MGMGIKHGDQPDNISSAWLIGPQLRRCDLKIEQTLTYSHESHSWTDSVRFHCTVWTHSSSPLAAHTRLHASLVRLQSPSSDLTMSKGHPAYNLVPMQHGHLTLWSNMHHDQKIILAEPRLQPALPEYMTPVIEDPTAHG